MGSDLYVSIEVGYQNATAWLALFKGRSMDLARGIIVDAFGDCADRESDPRPGYLTGAEIRDRQDHDECPWKLDEPYWVRLVPGEEFASIVRDKRWRILQDGDLADLECGPELRAVAALVEALLVEGLPVRVWCWHSQ
jgi:hypothetical protein